jgi:hypothetical protein
MFLLKYAKGGRRNCKIAELTAEGNFVKQTVQRERKIR